MNAVRRVNSDQVAVYVPLSIFRMDFILWCVWRKKVG